MTKAWLGWASVVALATLVGCGSNGGGSFNDGGGSEDGSGDASADAKGSDGTLSNDTSGMDGASDSTVHDSGPSDSLLDLTIPDHFSMPDEGADSPGADAEVDSGCDPAGITCEGSTAVTCKAGKIKKAKCGGSTPVCAAGYGCVVCDPGGGSCSGSTGTLCKSDGSGYQTNNCDPELGLTCLGGVCTGDCADIGTSYIGCEYYAITMANPQLDQSVFGYYVIIANQGASSATVNITGGALGSTSTNTIAAGSIQEILLPWVPAVSTTTTTTLNAGAAYHIKSNEPVTVYQFNAKDYESGPYTFSYTNDASLLLPVNAMTGNYAVAAWPTWNFYGWYGYYGLLSTSPGTIAIVGTQAGTTVTVTPPAAAFQAGAGLIATGGTVTLNAGDVLQIGTSLDAAFDVYGTDPSGTIVTASAPVEVFGGSSCTPIPNNVGACDHIEEIQFPVETLGNDYLVTLPNNVNGTPQQYVKIIGTTAGTTLTFDPPTGYNPAPATSLSAGQVTYFETTQHFHVTSTQPIAVAQYMVSENNFSANDTAGDPAESMAVATAQFRTTYGFTAPPNYIQNWVNVIAPVGATVTVTDFPSNQTITTGTAIGSSGYYVADVQICDNNLSGCAGQHTASSASPFGIQVYGYGSYTSYMYPGGLNLNR